MNARRTLAIMQPTFLPWIGYFAMIDRVDEFIYLDSVQFARRSWQQRNRIKTAQGELMLTIPVLKKGMRDQQICETQIDLSGGFGTRHWRSIEGAYRNAPHFVTHAAALEQHFAAPAADLADFNIGLIETLCRIFGIDTPRRRSSDMTSRGSKADLLAALCREAGADRYLSAPGSKDYIEESRAFEEAGVTVDYHLYEHPVYAQGKGEFLPYMAAIDMLFHLGAKEALTAMRAGVAR